MFYAPLPQRSLLAVSGEDAITFLQGLITNDVRKLESGKALYAALLSPQGKFLHDFFLYPWQGKILIDCDKSSVDDLKKRLLMYKLRSKISIEPAPENVGVVAVWGAQGSEFRVQSSEKIFSDPRLPELGCRIIGEVAAIEKHCISQKVAPGDYDAMRLSLGVPDGSRDMMSDKHFPLECGLDALHGIDFSKGCYVGQEVTARTKYRGQVRKCFYQITANVTLPPPGTPITAGGKEIGQMRSSAGNIGLAFLRIEETANAQVQGLPLMSGDIPVTAVHPRWLQS